ncbi:MAG: Mov34/MPN/PAD-1 family protein [Candidatus Promineifilaceae bacterium]
MLDNLVTYHIHKQYPLPANDALAYQYVLAGNGVFVRAKTRFFKALLPITACTVRGLPPLRAQFQLLVPRIPARLLDAILADARSARRSGGGQPDNGLNEVLYQFHHHGRAVQVKKPAQQTTPISVTTTVADAASIICDLHSHGNMRAFFSQTDNADEQGARLYAVIGRLDSEPEMRLRVGVYGYWLALPLTAVFTNNGSFKDLYQEKQDDKQRF